MKNLIIRNMQKDEIGIAIDMAAEEGWNPGLYDGEVFYNTDPSGFFIAELNGNPAGVISAVSYGKEFGFIGFYIVKKELRGHTIGIHLGKTALNYLNDANIGIDGVLEKVKNYEFYGFKYAYQNARYEGIASNILPKIRSNIFDISKINYLEILEFDNKFFPVPRTEFLKNWIIIPESYGFVYKKNAAIYGYGIIRKCGIGYKIGPLFAENVDVAEILLDALISKIPDEKYFLDIPEINQSAVKITIKRKMKKVFATARMFNKNIPELPINKIFGITSFELG
ncbi:MAG TPA: GNAT family N-acetyltransferase [bacterium]|nr:GNAT family N-acetyltransferase [bacterium]HPN30719.1 GNAT family N-acetyltransferase [bacterium]